MEHRGQNLKKYILLIFSVGALIRFYLSELYWLFTLTLILMFIYWYLSRSNVSVMWIRVSFFVLLLDVLYAIFIPVFNKL